MFGRKKIINELKYKDRIIQELEEERDKYYKWYVDSQKELLENQLLQIEKNKKESEKIK